ncbi:hypothetical protein [Labrenzia sp. VG12]|uniref:hypothetical protein n=1 Tax=Labrenzia sp. VG12 TaxID=2021862 RepID=UPI000B8C329E|nr:hypothetical protein [Labrenzia sp. VG12]ASP36183.1 hypothetical protein CHH27_25435 [Labrenzia sp. VG12]
MSEAVAENGAAENGQKKPRSGQTASNLVIGIWLVLLYVVTISISILMLSSYQIQSRIQYVNISDTRLSIWRLIELSNVYSVEKNILENRLQELQQMQARLDGIVARRIELDAEYTKIFDPFYKDIRAFKSIVENSYEGFSFKPLPKHHLSVKILYTDVAQQLEGLTLTEDHQAMLKELEQRQKRGDDVFRNLGGTKRNEDETRAEVSEYKFALKTISDKIRAGVYGTISTTTPYDGLDENEKSLLQDAVSEFSSLKNILWKLPYNLAIMPAEVLVLFLVLAMGVLGSTIFITQLYFRRDKYQGKYDEHLNAAFFFSRPWFGAITALSIYVLAKAGVLFLTDPSTQSGSATLSPFFISFIAIISGLFSEQAIQAIKTAADNWFKNQDPDADRWGVGLATVIGEKQRDTAQFAEASGVPLSTVEGWISENKPVPPRMQDILSVWLETPSRKLFTDIPPPATAKDDA